MKETIRIQLKRSLRPYLRVVFLSWLLIAAIIILSILFGKKAEWIHFFIIPVFLVFFITLLRMQCGGIKCPVCGVNLYGLCFFPNPKFKFPYHFSFSNVYHYCPGCAKKLDEEILKKV